MKEGYLYLADGRKFPGYLVGGHSKAAEVVFNTAMTGYEESYTDPSYTDQILTLTYPLIGNYGVNHHIWQGERPSISGAIVSELTRFPSNWESEDSLGLFFKANQIPVLIGADTRAITRAIRKEGTPIGVLATAAEENYVKEALAHPLPQDQIARVTTPVAYKMGEGRLRVTVIDCGIKRRMLDHLVAADCHLTVVPAQTKAAQILATRPDGVFISNGPGNPADVPDTIQALRELVGKVPMFGICMGHQLLAQALGAVTFKLPFGHRGANHPVIDLATKKITMTAQNHGYAVSEENFPAELVVTHRSLNDGTIEGFRHRTLPIQGIQYHPEAAPGPTDNEYLFTDWMKSLKGERA